MSKYVIIVGYNNTRIYDVAKIRKIAQRKYDSGVILIHENPAAGDQEFADFIWRYPLVNDIENSLMAICSTIAQEKFEILGVLPFSDRGVELALRLESKLKALPIKCQYPRASLDKEIFRKLDQQTTQHPQNYQPIFSKKVFNYNDYMNVIKSFKSNVFVKPSSEGNSRGCYAVESTADAHKTWTELVCYHNQGILIETLIENVQEYSWDYVAGTSWITDKKITHDQPVKAEIQQIVPARLSTDQETIINQTGKHMMSLISNNHGAYHNEIFLNHINNQSFAVEVNMRPAGMHIWDLAMLAFSDFNPWENWLDFCISGKTKKHHLQFRRYAGIRQIASPLRGILNNISDLAEFITPDNCKIESIVMHKKIGDYVDNIISDNASFIGHIILTSENYDMLEKGLIELTCQIQSKLVIVPTLPKEETEILQ